MKYWESTRVRNRWQECLQAMEWHLLNEECVGGISEVFDGDAPHTAGGTVDQAWSVGELLRIAYMMDTLKD